MSAIERIAAAGAADAGLAALRAFFAARMGGRHALTMAQRRASFRALMEELHPPPEDVSVAHGTIGGVPAEVLHAWTPDTRGAILYLHGGAFVSGSPGSHRRIAAELARATRMEIVLLDYRLAPEHPFPAAIGDAIAAWRALAQREGRPVAIAGDSAGGNLALTAALRLRDAGEALPAAIAVLSPFVDLTLAQDAHARLAAVDPFLTTAGLDADVARYLPDAALRRDPRVSPLFADLRGLPPIFVQFGTDEILYDENVALVERLAAAGVPVRAQCWERMVHNWHLFPNWLPEADAATAQVAAFLRAHGR